MSNSPDNITAPLKLKIVGMDCGSCAMTIEDSMRKMHGVTTANVSFTTETMEVAGEVNLDEIETRLKDLGYAIASPLSPAQSTAISHRGSAGFLTFLWGQGQLRRAIYVALAVIIGFFFLPSAGPIMGVAPMDALLIVAVLVAGAPVFVKGFRALFFANRITIDLLMAIAAAGALGIGEYGEAITVILLFMLGEALEAYSAERARDSLRSLMALQPQQATVLTTHVDSNNNRSNSENNHGQNTHEHSVELPVDQVQVGDRVLVRPAQRIPVDGIIIKGLSYVDQAPVTGESIPVIKEVDDQVMAGTVNGEAALVIRTTKIAAQGTIARIAKLVELAQSQRSPAERFIDRFARWYTPTVVALAALLVVVPVYGFGQPLMSTAETTGWLYRGLAMLIIACPCALVISIPVTVVSGLTRLANLGVLVKGGAQLDRLADIKAIAFDKTGTLTYGKPKVIEVRSLNCDHQTTIDENCAGCNQLLAVAAAVEHASEHPIASAIVKAAQHRNGAAHLAQATAVRSHPGKGVSGEVAGKSILVGTGDLFNSTMTGWSTVAPYAEAAKDKGATVMYVAEADYIIGYIAVQDEIRRTTTQALATLATMHIHTVLLTGDHLKAAHRVAAATQGIDEIYAQLMPEDKLAYIEKTQQGYGAVAMVGDGINDAPALARADVGIAMGAGGTAQAMETADVVLMQDDLQDVSLALRIARKSRTIIKQNIVLSLLLKMVFLSLAIPGLATLWMAVLADVGATLLVTLNGMRMLRQK